MVARLLWEQDAAGSNPVTSTILLEKPPKQAVFLHFKFGLVVLTSVIYE